MDTLLPLPLALYFGIGLVLLVVCALVCSDGLAPRRGTAVEELLSGSEGWLMFHVCVMVAIAAVGWPLFLVRAATRGAVKR